MTPVTPGSGPDRPEDDREVVDLTGTGQYNMLNEGDDDRRYQWAWWLPIVVAAVVAALVALLLLV